MKIQIISIICGVVACLLVSIPYAQASASVIFPNGVLIRANTSPKVFFVDNGRKRPFESPEMLTSQFRWDQIIVTTQQEVDSLPTGAEMTFRDGSLISNKGSVYVVSDGKVRPIESVETFLAYGYKWSNVRAVSDAELSVHPRGDILTRGQQYPNGSLLVASDGRAYVIDAGKKRYILSPLIFESRYRWESLIGVSDAVLDSISSGDNMVYPDGLLIRSETGVYIMQNNKRNAITSPEVFESYGLNWGQIKKATEFELSQIVEGPAFSTVKSYANGSLVSSDRGEIYVVSNGSLRYISSPRIFVSYGYDWTSVLRLPARVTDQYLKSGNVLFSEGTLISYGGGVYKVENGKIRPIPSPQIFNALGFSWSRVVAISQGEFDLHPLGSSFSEVTTGSLEGYSIPATVGRVGREQHLARDCNETADQHYARSNTGTSPSWLRNGLLTTGGAFALSCPAGSVNSSYANVSVDEEKYYITMRWNYVTWYEATSILTQSISASDNRIPLQSVSDYPNTGWVIINGEIIAFNGKEGNSLIVAQRGVDSPNIAASPRSHTVGSTVQEVYEYASDTWRGRTRSKDFNPTAKSWHKGKKVLVTNPANGKKVVASIMESGPAIFTNRVSGLSPEAMAAVGAFTDTVLEYGFVVDQSIPLGPLQ